jgi:hypothetical protein
MSSRTAAGTSRAAPVDLVGRQHDVAMPVVEARRVLADRRFAARLDVGQQSAHRPRAQMASRFGFGRLADASVLDGHVGGAAEERMMKH